MLSTMRTTANSIFMKALMVLLVISFGVWGVGDILRSRGTGDLVRVGDQRVNYAEFARASSETERMMQAMGLNNIPKEALQQQVLRRLVEEKIVDQRLRDAGLEVNDALLIDRLKQAQQFHDVKGNFDPKLFKAAIAQRNMNEAMFLDELRADLRASLFSESLSTEGMHPPEAVAALYAQAAGERRSAVVISIPASAVEVKTPSASAAKSYYEQNKELLYLQPEKRTLQYVTFSAKDLETLAEKQVTPEVVADRVASDPEHYKDEQIARDELKNEAMEQAADTVSIAVEDALAAGDNMDKAVAKAGLNAPAKTLADLTADAPAKDPLLQAVIAKGFGMEQGDTSGLETSAEGQYYLVNVQKVTAAEPKPYAAVEADVKQRVALRARNRALRAKAEDIKTALEKSKDWRVTVKSFGVVGREVADIARPENGAAAKNGLNPALAEAVFQHEVDGVAGPLLQADKAELAKVTGITVVKTTAGPDAKLAETLSKDTQQEVLENYYRTLTKRYPVTLNQKMMQQIQGQDGGA